MNKIFHRCFTVHCNFDYHSHDYYDLVFLDRSIPSVGTYTTISIKDTKIMTNL